MITHASLFSGIGGFDLAAQQVGWQNVLHCENNPFCQRVLRYYWPNAISYADIKTTDTETLGAASQLNPRFVAEMMGFPPDWTELPFHPGANNPSTDTETP